MPTSLDEAQQGLVLENKSLAPFLAAGYRGQARAAGITFDDLVGEANLGLCIGASRFDPDLVDLVLRKDENGNDEDDATQVSRAFRSYVGKWIQGALLRAIALATAFPTVLLYPDALEAAPEETLSDKAMGVLWDAIDELPYRDRVILMRRFGLGGVGKMTLEKIHARLSVSPKMVRQSVLRSFVSIASHINKAQ